MSSPACRGGAACSFLAPDATQPSSDASAVVETRSFDALSKKLGLAGCGSTVTCSLDGHTQLSLRRFDSKRMAPPDKVQPIASYSVQCLSLTPAVWQQVVPCLSLTNIEVAPSQRRRGHARTTLRALTRYAGDSRRLLVVENVVSSHMHALIGELEGQPLPGNRPGATGCNYWVGPPSARAGWQPHELAV